MPGLMFFEWRLFERAFFNRNWASGMKPAAGGRVHWTGNIAFEDDSLPFPLDFGIRNRNRRNQRLRIGMKWRQVNFFGFRKLDDLTEVHDRDAVADMFYKIESVGNKKVSQIELFLQLFEEVDDLCLNGNVERRYRLVAYQKGRFYR